MIEAIFNPMQQLYEALGSTAQISPWVYVLVMIGGIASAISPCYIPVLAMFGGYVGGYARETKTGGLRLALPFILGNAATLAAVGAIATVLGKTALNVFTGYQLDRWIPGVVGLVMGLQLLGIVKLKLPVISTLDWEQKPGSGFGALALGLPFGLVVTPCTIPIFFAIVTFVALQGSVLHGAFLMVAYALGRGIILTAVAVSVGFLKALNIARSSRYVARASGILILAVSIALLLFYDSYGEFTARQSSSLSDADVVLGQERGENHPGRGTVVSIDQNGAKVTLKHDEIRGLMPPMTMQFNVQPTGMLKNFRVGDTVQFTLNVHGGDFIITSLEKEQLRTPIINRGVKQTGDKHMKEVKLQVKGMSCSGCEQRIQKVLARIEGVLRSAADHQAEEVRVVFDSNRTSEEALRTSIEQAGYEVVP